MIDAQIIADSLAPSEVRLTTFILTYPRFMHAELMTHRVFSRNASSSRAIPVKKQIQWVIDNPAIPMAFTKNKKGMQGGEILTGKEHDEAVKTWLEGRDRAVEIAQKLADLEIHKQYANRVIEPYSHIGVIVTATDYDNFFGLRIHEHALPEIHELAKLMHYLRSVSEPRSLEDGQWHLPLVDEQSEIDTESFTLQHHVLIKKSVARCARVSYLNHEGKKPSTDEDLALYKRLVGSSPIHASPAEHQAMAISDPNVRSGNLRGWIQYRKTLKNENIKNYSKFNGLE